MKILDEQFRNGQASYARGIGLRTICEEANALMDGSPPKEAEGISMLIGYLDGVVASIRRTDNLLTLPNGPDR
jgi:hypothetical protein